MKKINEMKTATNRNQENRKEVKNMNKKGNIRTKVAASVLSGLTVFSVVSMSMAGVMAAAKDEVLKTVYNEKTIFYSDNYFRHSSTEFDPHLATLSMITTDNTDPRGNPKDANDTDWYISQPNLLEGFYEAIGFEDFETNEDYRKPTGFDTIGLAAANREVDDFTVVAVTVRSGGYFREWANNVWLGDGSKSDYMHEGFYNAGVKLVDFLEDYVESEDITGKVKVWVCGFSRGGATSNIAAGLLDNKIKNNETIFDNGATLAHDDLFAYTFEAPQGANYNSKTVEKPGSSLYNNIWNMVNPNDLVPKVAMSEFGFTRFGTDKYITTKFYDPANFETNRETFKYMYKKNGNDYNDYHGDEFTMYNVPLKTIISILHDPSCLIHKRDIFEKDTHKVNYDANIVSTLFLEEMTKVIGTRENYCKTYQSNMRDLLLCIMDDVKATSSNNIEDIINATIACTLNLAAGGSFDNSIEVMEKFMTKEEAKNAVKCMQAIAGIAVCVAVEKPNEMISLALQYSNVLKNHDSKVNIAHMQAQDSYYWDDEVKSLGLSEVPLRDNADFGRISFKDFNDIGLFHSVNGLPNVVRVTGAKGVDSTITKCDAGYAVGYYRYMLEERMEVFMPANEKYVINFISYSLKPSHEISYTATYQCIGPNSKGCYKQTKDSYKESNEWCDSDFMQRGVNMVLN